MKKKLFAFLLPLIVLPLSSCTFFDLVLYKGDSSQVSNNSQYSLAPLSYVEGEINQVQLNHTYKELVDHSIYNIDAMPSIGEPHMLVVPLWFNDSNKCIAEKNKDIILEDLNNTFFGTSQSTGWESVSSYYEKESYGKCKITGEVLPWQNIDCDAATLEDKDSSNDNNVGKILKEVINNWKINNPSKVKDYDLDSNGVLDAVVLIYGYYDNKTIQEENLKYRLPIPGEDNDNLWAYTYWLQESNMKPNPEDPIPNSYMFASFDFMYDNTDRTVIVDAHTYIHETGHLFGLEDYYNYADTTFSPEPQFAGKFSMQDYNVGGHDPHSIIGLGWTNPYVVYGNGEIKIRPFVSSGDVILLPSTNDKSVFDEYILIELYSPTGVNQKDCSRTYKSKNIKGPNNVGIRIWHVDARIITPDYSSSRSNTWSKKGITTYIEEGKTYDILNSNTTYKENYSSYCSVLPSCRDYKLLELVRKNDYTGLMQYKSLSDEVMFYKGNSFVMSNYSGYFKNGTFNNESTVKYNVSIVDLSNDEATIQIEVIQ